MGLKKLDLEKAILKRLALLSYEIELNNSVFYTDINKACENFYCKVLNLIYDYDLKNINIDEENATAIDLGDKNKRIAIQVTSERTLSKVRYTLKKFVTNSLDTKYDKLFILRLAGTTNHNKKTISEGGITLDTCNDIIDLKKLSKKISSLSLDKLNRLWEIIEQETSALDDTINSKKSTWNKRLSEKVHSFFKPENLIEHFPEVRKDIKVYLTELKTTPRYIYPKHQFKTHRKDSVIRFVQMY